ncbi:uncharacterized protein LOC118732715, partial [Rhagoletis pomonella]|uniref:uncharacterized protein LOC118732715 n=1 Tax=Rhagoletis pomonella TaxID=28610 RepID=UPI00177FF560
MAAHKEPKKSFADAARESLVRAVIDRNAFDGGITQQNWDLVTRKLWAVYREVLRDNVGPPPFCSDAGWLRGVKMIKCADERSAQLYKAAINKIGEPWPGARLDVVKREEIPNRPKSRAWIPEYHDDSSEVLGYIQLGNPELPTHDWKVVKLDLHVYRQDMSKEAPSAETVGAAVEETECPMDCEVASSCET